MKSVKYRCLVDGFSAVAKGQELIICGDSATTTDGVTLMIKTQYVKDHPEEFELVGEVEDAPTKTEEKPTPTKPQYLVVHSSDGANSFATEKEAIEYAEANVQAGTTYIARITKRMQVKLEKIWEA